VSTAISATVRHELPESHADDGDLKIFLDLDLAVLGKPSNQYDQYAKQIRREFRHVADDDYRRIRRRLLKNFLRRERLYFSTPMRDRFERQASVNLCLEISALENPEIEMAKDSSANGQQNGQQNEQQQHNQTTMEKFKQRCDDYRTQQLDEFRKLYPTFVDNVRHAIENGNLPWKTVSLGLYDPAFMKNARAGLIFEDACKQDLKRFIEKELDIKLKDLNISIPDEMLFLNFFFEIEF
jgi:hypothetical protein